MQPIDHIHLHGQEDKTRVPTHLVVQENGATVTAATWACWGVHHLLEDVSLQLAALDGHDRQKCVGSPLPVVDTQVE